MASSEPLTATKDPHAPRTLALMIERLRASVAQLEAECEEASGQWLQAVDIIGKLQAELARMRAAVPEMIDCAHGNAVACRERPTAKCCELRWRCIQHGLLTASEAPKEDAPDGA